MRRSALVVLSASFALALASTSAGAAPVVADRAAVRFVTPATGGSGRPRFISERELAFFTRIEALNEQVTLRPGDYPDRYVRSAIDRFVARAMLASLLIERGSEPPDLPALTRDARAELADRVGGQAALDAAMKREGIDAGELDSFLRTRVRALYYVDRAITPIIAVTEDSLREAFRSAIHPYRGRAFEDVRELLKRWLVTERLRAAELEFLQSARARVIITAIRGDERPR